MPITITPSSIFQSQYLRRIFDSRGAKAKWSGVCNHANCFLFLLVCPFYISSSILLAVITQPGCCAVAASLVALEPVTSSREQWRMQWQAVFHFSFSTALFYCLHYALFEQCTLTLWLWSDFFSSSWVCLFFNFFFLLSCFLVI